MCCPAGRQGYYLTGCIHAQQGGMHISGGLPCRPAQGRMLSTLHAGHVTDYFGCPLQHSPLDPAQLVKRGDKAEGQQAQRGGAAARQDQRQPLPARQVERAAADKGLGRLVHCSTHSGQGVGHLSGCRWLWWAPQQGWPPARHEPRLCRRLPRPPCLPCPPNVPHRGAPRCSWP